MMKTFTQKVSCMDDQGVPEEGIHGGLKTKMRLSLAQLCPTLGLFILCSFLPSSSESLGFVLKTYQHTLYSKHFQSF